MRADGGVVPGSKSRRRGRRDTWRGALLALVVATAPALAADATVAPGEYITEGGWGVLVVKPAPGGPVFSLEAVGANFHICSVEGPIRNGVADLEGDGSKRCVVRFRPQAGGVDVSSNGEPCRTYCGARAGFEGMYLRPAPGCAPSEVRRTRATFKQQFDRKAFAEARTLLEPVATRCAKTLQWADRSWIANDLALTAHRLGDHAACRRLLAPLDELAKSSDADIRGGYPPSDAEVALRIAQATRFNLKLCAGK
jgi:hypothetical protein